MSFSNFTKELMWEQLDDKVKHFKGFTMPRDGWIKTIRTALGISRSILAKRCKISRQRLDRIEHDEVAKKTTLETLENVAKQLDCKFVYAFVPKDKLAHIVEKQAERKAIKQVEIASHSMALENQALSKNSLRKQIQLTKKAMLSKSIKDIWK